MLAHELLVVNRADSAIGAQELANGLYERAGDRVRFADGLRRLSRFYSCGGRGAEAEAPMYRSVALLEAEPESRELALAYAYLVGFQSNEDLSLDAASRALDLAERFQDDETLVHVLNSVGTGEVLRGIPGGKEKVLRSLELALELGMDEHAGRAYLNLTDALTRVRDYDGFMELAARGIDFSVDHGLELWRMWIMTSVALACLDMGDWSRSAEVADAVLRGEMGQLPRIAALPVMALIRSRRGDPEVGRLLDEAASMASRESGLQWIVPVAVARAEVAWLEGRNDAIRAETEAAFVKATQMDAWWRLGELSCWRSRAGLRDEVHPLLPERYRAELEGDYARAAELWNSLGCVYDGAMALAASDDEELLRRSLTTLQRLGARAAAAVVARKLRALGAQGITRGPRPTTQRNPALLTEREMEVLELIGVGMRNSEIARKLFLTTKTVDHHVSAILRKLGVDSRSQAAAEAAKLGLRSG